MTGAEAAKLERGTRIRVWFLRNDEADEPELTDGLIIGEPIIIPEDGTVYVRASLGADWVGAVHAGNVDEALPPRPVTRARY